MFALNCFPLNPRQQTQHFLPLEELNMILLAAPYGLRRASKKDKQDKDQTSHQQKEAFHYQQQMKSIIFGNLKNAKFENRFRLCLKIQSQYA